MYVLYRERSVMNPAITSRAGRVQAFWVPGRLPGANECLWKHRHTMQRKKQTVEELVAVAIRRANIRPVQRAKLRFYWYEPNQRRDMDNVIFGQKFILDGLVKCGILPNDGWKQIASLTHSVGLDKAYPGVTVSLEEVAE